MNLFNYNKKLENQDIWYNRRGTNIKARKTSLKKWRSTECLKTGKIIVLKKLSELQENVDKQW